MPLDGTFEAIWKVWTRSVVLLRALLGTLFGMLTGVRRQEIRFCCLRAPERCSVGALGRFQVATGAFLDASGSVFGLVHGG